MKYITVKGLIDKLKEYDEDLIVWRDYEGLDRGIDFEDFEVSERGLRIAVDY